MQRPREGVIMAEYVLANCHVYSQKGSNNNTFLLRFVLEILEVS